MCSPVLYSSNTSIKINVTYTVYNAYVKAINVHLFHICTTTGNVLNTCTFTVLYMICTHDAHRPHVTLALSLRIIKD